MRHGKGLRQLSRNTSHRRALLRNLATSFFKYESFETTVPKAKELRPVVERLITLGKNDTLAARRQAYSYLMDKAVVHKLFAEIGPRCSTRNGGYTRIVRTRVRHGDAAEMAIIELVDKVTEKAVAKKADSKKAPAKKAAPKKTAPKKTAEKKAPAKKKAAASA
ncbi:MAG: 50S ribosomal protein L17 [Proteobacteria bacterium]|nr:50S ribosomal protein L17 [Pseudomonadota bacterium]